MSRVVLESASGRVGSTCIHESRYTILLLPGVTRRVCREQQVLGTTCPATRVCKRASTLVKTLEWIGFTRRRLLTFGDRHERWDGSVRLRLDPGHGGVHLGARRGRRKGLGGRGGQGLDEVCGHPAPSVRCDMAGGGDDAGVRHQEQR